MVGKRQAPATPSSSAPTSFTLGNADFPGVGPGPVITGSTLSIFATSTYVATNAEGPTVVTTTVFVTTVPSTTTVSTQSSSSSSTPIAAIVGGVVGGVVVLVVIAFLIYFIRRRSSGNEFDRNFEPDRVINQSGRGDTLPQLDLSDEANIITPFDAYAADGDEGMRQHNQPPFASGPPLIGVTGTQAQQQMPSSSVPPNSASYDSDDQSYLQGAGGSASGNFSRQSPLARPPQGAALPAGHFAQPKQSFMYDSALADWHAPRLSLSLPPSMVPSASASSGSAKEGDAAGDRGTYGLGLAPQCEPLERSESPLGPTGEMVVVHQDAGRALEEVDIPREIPPAYDSIRH